MQTPLIFTVPAETLVHIFSFLPKNELLETIPFVCRAFHALSKETPLWREIDHRTFKKSVLLHCRYANQIAIERLLPEASRAPFRALNHRPFEQRALLLRSLFRPMAAAPSEFSPDARFPISDLSALRDRFLSQQDAKTKAQFQCVFFGMPLGLKNIGNSSYLDSVLQALLCCERFVEEFKRPLLPPRYPEEANQDTAEGKEKLDAYRKEFDLFAKKHAIQQEILQFVQLFQSKDVTISWQELITFILKSPSVRALRETIFDAGLDIDFDRQSIKAEHDPAILVGFLIEHFCPQLKFQYQEHTSAADDFPGLEFLAPCEERFCLNVPIKEGFGKLKDQIHWVLHKKYVREADPQFQRRFDPKDGIVINASGDPANLDKPAKKVAKYIQSYQLTRLSPLLVLRFGRFINPRQGISNFPIRLPEDGILDLTRYLDSNMNGSTAIYRN